MTTKQVIDLQRPCAIQCMPPQMTPSQPSMTSVSAWSLALLSDSLPAVAICERWPLGKQPGDAGWTHYRNLRGGLHVWRASSYCRVASASGLDAGDAGRRHEVRLSRSCGRNIAFEPAARSDDRSEPTSTWYFHSAKLFTLRTQARTSASTSGSTSLTSWTVMPALIRGS